jgi:hypothetical protein
MFLEEQATNLVRGQGFRSNDQVLSRFVANKNYQGALDYFGFEGTYDPNNPLFEQSHGDAITNSNTGDIYYRDAAFQKNYDFLYKVADHERIHSLNVRSGKHDNITDWYIAKHEEEWSTYMHNYRNQGLYPKHGAETDLIANINYHGMNANIYYTLTRPNFFFQKQWWHFIYKIPRRW